jgi:hypothetical protein
MSHFLKWTQTKALGGWENKNKMPIFHKKDNNNFHFQ